MIISREEPLKMVPLSFVERLKLQLLENYEIINLISVWQKE